MRNTGLTSNLQAIEMKSTTFPRANVNDKEIKSVFSITITFLDNQFADAFSDFCDVLCANEGNECN